MAKRKYPEHGLGIVYPGGRTFIPREQFKPGKDFEMVIDGVKKKIKVWELR